MSTAVSNRLHRSGAVDFNVEFATRQASIYGDTKNSSGKRMHDRPNNEDSMSVCEGEPLYAPKRHKGNQFVSDSVRNPIACISTLNGMPANIANPSTKPAAGTAEINFHEEIRDKFFRDNHYMGISVSKWAFGRAGQQQDQFVATAGGINTIYCDVDCQAGDTIVVDIPMPTASDIAKLMTCYDPSAGNQNQHSVWAFAKCVSKKGTPKEKQTLVIRPMPPTPLATSAHYGAIVQMRKKFQNRRQIVGTCIKGAKKGERIDLVLGASAICGCVNMSDLG